jgi:TRAP-type mannitol/chloroaromatic compound transport system permease small subunit
MDGDDTSPALFEAYYFAAFIYLGFWITVIFYIIDLSSYKKSWGEIGWWVAIFPVWYVGLTVALMLYFGFVIALVVSMRGFGNVIRELKVLDAWPEDVACPLLWKDPLADVLWGLA